MHSPKTPPYPTAVKPLYLAATAASLAPLDCASSPSRTRTSHHCQPGAASSNLLVGRLSSSSSRAAGPSSASSCWRPSPGPLPRPSTFSPPSLAFLSRWTCRISSWRHETHSLPGLKSWPTWMGQRARWPLVSHRTSGALSQTGQWCVFMGRWAVLVLGERCCGMLNRLAETGVSREELGSGRGIGSFCRGWVVNECWEASAGEDMLPEADCKRRRRHLISRWT